MRLTVGALLTILAGSGAVAVAATRADRGSVTTAALLLAAAIACELADDAEHGRRREAAVEQPLRLVAAVHLASIVLVGPWAAAIVAAVGTIVGRAPRRSAWGGAPFDAAAFALATLAGGGAYVLAGGTHGSLTLLDGLVPLIALAVAYVLVRSIAFDLVGGHGPFQPNFAAAAAEAALAAVAVELVDAHPWNALALVPLGLAVSRAFARASALRRETLRALETFANIVDERDPSTYRHSVRVAGYVDRLSRALGFPSSDVDALHWAARLHDLGKVAVDASVLAKPGALDAREWEAVRRHPRLSARLLQRFQFTSAEARSVELHHERMDGNGYYGVAGEDVPLAAHVLAVADSFDAMTTDRPYRAGLSRDEALAEIERHAGTQFHPAVAKAFVAVQRGESPFARLEPAEAGQLRTAAARYRLPAVPGTGDLKERPDIVAIAGTLLGLVGVGTGDAVLAGIGFAVALGGVALATRVRLRAARLARDLRATVEDGELEGTLAAIVARLATDGAGAWGAFVSSLEFGLGARVEAEVGSGPAEAEVVGWLLREADGVGDAPLEAPGAAFGGEGLVVAVPLRRDNGGLVGFLVVHWARSLPRHVRAALAAAYDDLAAAFVSSLDRRARTGAATRVVCPGTDVSLISVGPLSTAATEAAATAIARGLSVEVLEVDPSVAGPREAVAARLETAARAVVVADAAFRREVEDLIAATALRRPRVPLCTLADPTAPELAQRLEELCAV